MSEADNCSLVEEAYEALNAHDINRYEKTVDDSQVIETVASPTPIHGREAIKHFIASYFKAFPDFHQDIEQMIASGDSVVSRWHFTGTQRGEYNGVSPTNRQISLRGCTISEIWNGRIVKSSIFFDQLAILQQLGVARAAGAAS
jgi:steroid delta-isomerase-like uncharacterized protein